ncbi:MAG: hypothetical protein K8S00_06445 [Bacteroidales bacterium]|nr:hypothetical protein [Bacteroidales bacterium]
MKRSLLFLTLIILAMSLHSQNNYTLKMHSFSVDVNGKSIGFDKEITVQLVPDVEKQIEIYNSDGIRFVAVFKFTRSNNRLKLIRWFYGHKFPEKIIKSKKKKDVQFIKVSAPGSWTGMVSENILLDKKKLESIYVTFKYEFLYN